MIAPLRITVIMIVLFQMAGISKTFAAEPAVFRGQVVDVEGKAVKGAELFIYSSPDTRRPADFISERTDEDGHFSISLSAGKRWAVARLRRGDKYGPLMAGDKHSGEPVEIEAEAGKELIMDFTVAGIMDAARLANKKSEDFVKIEGRILNRQGAPVQMYYVIADKKNNPFKIPDYISSWTDKAGHYALYLRKGEYIIGYADKFPPDGYIVYKELKIGSDKNNFDIVVEKE